MPTKRSTARGLAIAALVVAAAIPFVGGLGSMTGVVSVTVARILLALAVVLVASGIVIGHADGVFSRLLRPWYSKAALGTLVVLAGMFVLMAIPDVHDPTEGVFPVTVVNSVGRAIDVHMCGDAHCHSTVDGHVLKPGESFWQNVGPDASVPFKVTAADGSPLGCWLLPARSHRGHYTVDMRSIVPCSSIP